MTELPALSAWDSFYVIVGSSGAALIGLQFVVIAIVKDLRTRTSEGTLSAFATPTVVHLGGALVLSAIMSAPWPTLLAASVALVVAGVVGLGYGARVMLHARRQTAYRPVLEDWLWHFIMPNCAYAGVVIGGFLLAAWTRTALFAIAAGALGLLLISIHNAWDTVIYIVIGGDDVAPRVSATEPPDQLADRSSPEGP